MRDVHDKNRRYLKFERYFLGSASVARALSSYLDTLLNNTLQDAFIDIVPMHVSFLAPYFDFLAFGISFLLAGNVAIALYYE